MKTIKRSSIIMVLAVFALVGVSSYAFAQWGSGPHMGWGPHHGRGMGYQGNETCPGYGQGYGRGPRGNGYGSNLTEEQFKQLDEERQNFFAATEDVRRKIYQKELSLRSELVKENPNSETAKSLQKEISQLKSEFDEKRLDHRLKMHKIAPEGGWGFKGRGGKGSRMGTGPGQRGGGYGPGSRSGGYGQSSE